MLIRGKKKTIREKERVSKDKRIISEGYQKLAGWAGIE